MSSEEFVTETRSFADFDRVVFRGVGDLDITQGDQAEITIKGREDIVSRIETEVKGTTLHIELKKDWIRWTDLNFESRRIFYNLSLKKLKGLDHSGAGVIESDQILTDSLKLKLGGAGSVSIDSLEAETLEVTLKGAGKISLAGKVIDQDIRLAGAGSYQARNLESESANVSLSGAGSVEVRVEDVLDVKLTGLGSVRYYGDPIVKKRVTGLGSVNKA
jgi:hypothetical protein